MKPGCHDRSLVDVKDVLEMSTAFFQPRSQVPGPPTSGLPRHEHHAVVVVAVLPNQGLPEPAAWEFGGLDTVSE